MIIIYDSPGFRLGGKYHRHPITGVTVELYAKHPTVRRPRWQRITQLTLPDDARKALVTFLQVAGGAS